MTAANMIFSNQKIENNKNYLAAALLFFACLVPFEIQQHKIIWQCQTMAKRKVKKGNYM